MSSSRASRTCSQQGCPTVIQQGSRCTQHQRAQYRTQEARRGDRHQRGYGTQWDKLRAQLLPSKLIEYKGLCHLCSTPVSTVAKAPHPKAPSLDHITPKSKGGTDDPSNLALAHFGCNSARRDRGIDATVNNRDGQGDRGVKALQRGTT